MLARALLGVALLALVPVVASAQVSSTASAQAAELFDEGRALAARQDYGGACPKFIDSVKLEPKVGSLLNLADCEEHLGQLVAARGHWQDAASLARSVNDDRAAVAQQRFAALDPRVAKLTVVLANPDMTGALRVTRDGVELGAGSLGASLPLDPGTHTVVVSGPGYEVRTYSVTLGEGETRRVTVEPGVAPATPSSAPPSTWNSRKTLALVTAGAGVAGLAVGSIFGLVTLSEYNTSNSAAGGGCKSGSSVCATSTDERDTAYRNGNVSTVAFVVGGLGLATGAVLWFTAPRSSSTPTRDQPSVAMGPGSLLVRGVF